VRYDENDGENATGQKVAQDSKVSPRLAITWDPQGNGNWLFQGGYGEYVSAIASTQANATSQGGNPATFQFWYRGPAINAPGQPLVPADTALQQLWDWFDSVGGTANTTNPDLLLFQSIPGGTSVIGGGSLDSPHTTEYSLSATKRLGGKGLVRTDLVRREGHDFYVGRIDQSTGKVTTPTGSLADLEIIQNDDSVLERVYDGLHTQLQYRFTDKLNVGGNWTWSHLRGNWNGEVGVSGPVRSGVLARPEYFDLAWNLPRGALELDTRNRVRLFGIYDVFRTEHHALNVSLLQSFASGQPYGASAPVGTRPFVTNPGYSTPPANVTYWFTNRDRFHTDDIQRTDFSVNYSFMWNAFGKEFEVFLQPEVFNVFDDEGQEIVNQSVFTRTNRSTSFCPGFAATCNPAERITLQTFNPFTQEPVEGVHWVKGPDFGKSVTEGAFQTVRTFRFSVGFRF
jgi:hypothetical protein